MKDLLKKLKASIQIHQRGRATPRRKSAGQSLVELAIALPVLIMLFSGMVEFGFMLNTYLSLLDATRQTARYYSNVNPFMEDANGDPVDNMDYYEEASTMLVDILDPPSDPEARSIVLDDPAHDDIIISVIAVSVSESTDTIVDINRYPLGLPDPYYHLGNQVSAYADDDSIEALMTNNGTTPVRTGILIIEVFHGYEGVLRLPWIWGFMDTITLRADTIMPLVAAKPLREP